VLVGRLIVAFAILVAARAANAACPCQVEGMTLSDEEMAACNSQVMAIRAVQSRYARSGTAVPPGEIDTWKTSLKTCVDRQRQRAQQEARVQAAAEERKTAQAKDAEQARARGVEAEATRAEREQESAERRKADIAKQHDPKVMSTLASAQLCSAIDDRTEALKSIAEERRYAKQAGVANLTSLESFKNDLREADQTIANNRAVMKKQKWTALSCKEPLVVSIKDCLEARVLDVGEKADPADPCQSEKIQAFVRLVNL